ncbi:perlucin-like [Babylonia areolata]|uniref:perlucin-like n=1 Tax=Babylonia areolata TaxID=304850 RepID=UPI003FD6AD61
MKVFIVVIAALAAAAVEGQCPSGFVHHEKSCYSIPMTEGSWADGMIVCQELGGQLAVIETPEEQHFLEGYLKRYGSGLPNDNDFWVGGGDFLQEGKWIWVMPDTPITHTYWAPGQPDNHGGSQGCLRISGALGFKWEDGSCSSVEYPVCELPFRTTVEVGK